MSIRARRLRRDNEKVGHELADSKWVSVSAVSGDPPDHYRVNYRVNGLVWEESTQSARTRGEHLVEIFLPIGYPKQAPRCVMRDPVWHPNIGDYVCIGDYWSAGVTLVDIIVHIGDMIQYKSYNLSSPVNKQAAIWAERNRQSFPVGTRAILPPETDSPAPSTAPEPNGVEISLGPSRDRRPSSG